VTTFYNPDDPLNRWTSTVVTETILTQFVTYMDNTTIETVLTETQTVNQTKTITGWDDEIITHQTPYFTIEPTPGFFITVDAGPTYVVFNNISGGLDYYTKNNPPAMQCVPSVASLENWQPAATANDDWSYFVVTHTEELQSTPTEEPYTLPSKLIEYLKQDPDVQMQFNGLDIASCSYREPTHAKSVVTSTAAGAPLRTRPPEAPPYYSVTTGTFIATTYESTSVHVTVRGCLRCENTQPLLQPIPTKVSIKGLEPIASFGSMLDQPEQPDQSKTRLGQSDQPADNIAKPTHDATPLPDVPDVIDTLIHNNPSIWTRQTPAATVSKSITIGGVAVPINTASLTQGNSGRPNEQNQNPVPPVIIIGSETFTSGQTKTMNGVPVVIPTNGGGIRIVVDGSTVVYNPSAPTRGPVLTVGGGTITANPQGEFVFGTETLKPGGPAITVVGNTVSLSPSGVAIVNGITQALANAPAPTAAPALTVGGQTALATMVGGSTVFVVAPGQTLTPGGSLVVDGTTFSIPADSQGSTILINGQASRLSNGQSALTLASGHPVSATVLGGSTALVLAPGQTLTPGGTLIFEGTTYSMPANGHGSTIVVNGQTSTLGAGQSVLTLAGGHTITATAVSGTTAYVLAPGQTLTTEGVLTVSGTTYSMPASASGSVIVVNGVTSTLSSDAAIITDGPALTIEGITYSYTVRDGTTEYVLGEGTTLIPGSAVTIDGTTYSLDAGGTALVVDGKTSSISNRPKSTSAATTTSVLTSVDTNGRNVASSTTGIGEPNKAAAVSAYQIGFGKWFESLVIGLAGWLVMLV
jgi:hypothetical protein